MKTIFLGILIIGIFSCKNEIKETTTIQPDPSKQTEIDPEKTDEENLKIEASKLRAGGTIKSTVLEGKKATIKYVKDFEEYQSLNPNSRLSAKHLKNYWSTNNAMKKALVDGSVKLMKKLDFIDEISIELPLEGKLYQIDVSKSNLETFTGLSFESLCQNFDKNFSNKYVFNNAGIDLFFDNFGSIK